MVGNATIKAGKIEAGNKLYQTYIEAYKEKMHPRTIGGGFSGRSSEAYAISASGKVIIDGQGQFTPQVMSYTIPKGWFGKDPISSIFLENNGALYFKFKAYITIKITAKIAENNIPASTIKLKPAK